MRIKRKNKIIIIITCILGVLAFIIPQYKVNAYIKNQKMKYDILQNQKKIRFKPYTIFFIEYLVFKKYRFNTAQAMYPYHANKIEGVYGYHLYDSYILYSYYDYKKIVFIDNSRVSDK